MRMPTILYLHGFNSSPHTVKGRMLARAAAALPHPPCFHVPPLHHRPAQAIHDACAWIDNAAPDGRDLGLIGSSLGGFYATWLAERYGARAVVINPAIRPHESLRSFLGTQRNLYTGEAYEFTSAHLDELAALELARITRPERCFLLARTGDEVLAWREATAFYAGASQYVAGGGDHGWTDFGDEVASVLRFALEDSTIVGPAVVGPAVVGPASAGCDEVTDCKPPEGGPTDEVVVGPASAGCSEVTGCKPPEGGPTRARAV
jgi:uncharacterized protein